MPAIFAAVQAFGLILAAGSGSSAPVSVSPPPAVVETMSPAAVEPATSPQPEKPAEKKEPPAKTEPEKKAPAKEPPADPSTEDVLKEMEKQRGKAPAPTPSTAPPTPGPSTPAADAPPAKAVRPVIGRLLREGTFLVDRRGRMVRASNGDWTYAFDADAQNQADPTMILMPCQKLEAMEKLAERYGESVTFSVTGQVFVYKNRNYLLPGPFQVHRANLDLKTAQ